VVPDELEQAAQLTDAEAVRRVFDAHNAVWTAIFATVFALFDAGLLIYAFASGQAPKLSSWIAALQMIVAAAAAAMAMELANAKPGKRMRAPTRLVSRHLTDWIFAYFLVQYAVFAYIGGPKGTEVWGTLFPWLLLGLRLSFARRLAFLVTLYATALVFLYARNVRFGAKDLGGLAITYAIALAIGAMNSRRVRRKTIQESSERRESAREQLRMRDELRYARELQLSMLPDEPPSLSWADIAAISIPATEVGGDYFDYIDVDGSLAVICGDVAGHGLASGITLSALRGGIILLSQSLTNPSAVLERLHDVVAKSSRKRTLVTLTAALFDPHRRRATIASAGHPPVIVRRSNGTVETIELFGPPLGARRVERIGQREVSFSRGDVFLLHSDGIYEATNEAGEQYGLDRLARVVESSDGSAAEVRDAVLRSVEQFRGNAAQQDDVTVVVVKIY
jgi:serine phosphatase RsbU (regulator of sigma subunit)